MDSDTLILVVEDDLILKTLLGHTFADQYQILYANNGTEALNVLKDHKPALILLDLLMPDMDGFTFLGKVRSRSDELKNVPVIVVSNLGQQEDRDKALGLGANAYLVKAEVSVDEIVAKIKEILADIPTS